MSEYHFDTSHWVCVCETHASLLCEMVIYSSFITPPGMSSLMVVNDSEQF